MLRPFYNSNCIEAGVDEAGRGPLAGPVVAAAVILPVGYSNELLNDSKKLTRESLARLAVIIKNEALAWAIAQVSPAEIDQINILRASIKAMHLAVDSLQKVPSHLLIDGNKFIPYPNVPHTCVVKGDAKFQSIAAASILAKTFRDNLMSELSDEFPQYGWAHNFGYPTVKHRQAILQYGISPHHRLTFRGVVL